MTLYVTIKIEVLSNLSVEDTIDEFRQEAMYNIEGTDNVTVASTAWLDTSTQPPY